MNNAIDHIINLALTSLNSGDIHLVKQYLKKALVQDPKNFDALHIMGVALAIEGNCKDALNYLKKAHKLNPRDGLINLNLAKTLSDANKNIESIPYYLASIKYEPNNLDSQIGYIQALIKLMRFEDVIGISSKILDQHGNNPNIYLYRGVAFTQLKNFDSAIRDYDKAIELDPNYAEALTNRGVALKEMGKIDEALLSLNNAIKINPNLIDAIYNRAQILRSQKKYIEALDDFQKIILIDQGNSEAYIAQNEIFFLLERYDLTLKNYDCLIQLNPSSVDHLLGKGVALCQMKAYEDALACYEKAIKLAPKSYKPWINKGVLFSELKKFDDALKAFEKAIKINSDVPEAWLNKGLVYSDLGAYQSAIECYDCAIEKNNNFVEAWTNKANALSMQSKYIESLYCFDKALELSANDHKALVNKALTLVKIRDYDKAESLYDQAIRLNPNFADAYFNKSIMQLYLKRFREGWENFEWRLDQRNSSVESIVRVDHKLRSIKRWCRGQKCNRLLIIGEQGVGDVIFYSRSLRLLQGVAQSLTVLVDKRLIPLLKRSFKDINFKDEKSDVAIDEYDAHIPLGSIMYEFDISAESTDMSAPYLIDNQMLTNELRSSHAINKKISVGLSWNSENKKVGDCKSISLKKIIGSLVPIDCMFVNLQYRSDLKAIEEVANQYDVNIVTQRNIDLYSQIDELASLIKSLDFVVTISNVTAHLAGALGVKTFLIAPYSHGRMWYWHNENISCWYPSVSLHFQDENLQWDSALSEVKEKLNHV